MGWLRGFFTTLAVLLLAGSVALSVLRNVDSGMRLVAMVTSFASYAVVGYLLALLIAVLLLRGAGPRRSWLLVGAALSVAGLVLNAIWLAPLFHADGKARQTDLTVLTANLQFGLADAPSVVGAAVDGKVDVLVLEEVTYAEYARLERAGLLDLLPHVAGKPDYSSGGTMVFSAYPLTGARPVDVSNGGLSVQVQAPAPFRLIAAHPAQPVSAPSRWRRDLAEVRDAGAAGVRAGPTVLAGDFNATLDHPAFRAVLRVGLTDAVDSAGSGWQPTWPESLPRSNDSTRVHAGWLRPLIAIDHVLFTKQYAAVRTSTVPLPGSDHRALLVRLDRL